MHLGLMAEWQQLHKNIILRKNLYKSFYNSYSGGTLSDALIHLKDSQEMKFNFFVHVLYFETMSYSCSTGYFLIPYDPPASTSPVHHCAWLNTTSKKKITFHLQWV